MYAMSVMESTGRHTSEMRGVADVRVAVAQADEVARKEHAGGNLRLRIAVHISKRE